MDVVFPKFFPPTAVHRREIVGIAGVSGNGQRELVEVLGGQRAALTGGIEVDARPYAATRSEAQVAAVRYLPEEPLKNACAARTSVAENLAFRTFDTGTPTGTSPRLAFLLDRRRIAAQARALIVEAFGIKAASKDAQVQTLSGGNVERVVLARELSGEVKLPVVANPCFGLDVAAVAEIRGQLMAARNRGAAVLLVSEDLDELLELSDRVLVMSEGRIVYETRIESADTRTFFLHGRTSLRRQPSPRPFPFALDLRSAALIVIDMTLSSRGASAMSDQLPGDFIKPFSSLKNRGSHTISRALIAKPPRLPSEPQTNVLRLCSPRRRSSGRAGITCGATHADTALCNVGAWRSAQGVMSGELLRSIVVAPSRFCSKRRPVALER